MPLGTKVGLGPGHNVLHGDPASPPKRGHSLLPLNFRPMSIVAKRSPISATVEHLLYLQTVQHIREIIAKSIVISVAILIVCSICSIANDNAIHFSQY